MSATAKKTWPCSWCGATIDDNNAYGVGDDDMCQSCYDDATYFCGFCGEREENAYRGLVTALSRLIRDEDGSLEPGVYQVVSWPYYIDDMLGGFLLPGSLRRIGDGPEWLVGEHGHDPDGDYLSPAYHLCARCGAEALPRRTRSGMWSCAGKRYRTRALALRSAVRLLEAHAHGPRVSRWGKVGRWE